MLSFLDTMFNHEERKVANYRGKDCEGNEFVLDTCLVTDSKQPFETALSHPFYNNGDWIILQSYDTAEEAKLGHNKWFDVFVNKGLPNVIKDHVVGGFEAMLDDEDIYIKREQ